MPLEVFRSFNDWQCCLEARRDRYVSRWLFEQHAEKLDVRDAWLGWCGMCERDTHFLVPSIAVGAPANFREELICGRCGMNARVRAGLQILKENAAFDTRKPLYITEQASPTFARLQKVLPNVLGSEYVADPDVKRAMQQYLVDLGVKGKLRFEDVTRLTFRDASLGAIASFDVLEHVPDYRKAIVEFARTLRPGGMLALTAPFLSESAVTLVRAKLGLDGVIEHLVEPEYHGDPACDGGILCFYHFGWDLLDATREAGFSEACMVSPWAPGMGLMGRLWTLIAIR